MLRISTIFIPPSKKLLLSFLLTGATLFSFAGTGAGDGDNKSKNLSWPGGSFTPVKLTSGFTLKAGRNYRAGNIFTEERKMVASPDYVRINSIVTYQKGNITYILPHTQRVSVSAGKSGLQSINVRVNIRH